MCLEYSNYVNQSASISSTHNYVVNRRDARDSGPWHKRALAVKSTLKVRCKSIILCMGNKH